MENRLTKIHQRSPWSHDGIIDYIPATFLLEKSRSSSAQVSYTSLIDVTNKRARRSKVKRELENVTLSCQEQRRLPRGSRQPSWSCPGPATRRDIDTRFALILFYFIFFSLSLSCPPRSGVVCQLQHTLGTNIGPCPFRAADYFECR